MLLIIEAAVQLEDVFMVAEGLDLDLHQELIYHVVRSDGFFCDFFECDQPVGFLVDCLVNGTELALA